MSTGRRAVFFDRDDTLIYDVPYNGDPAKVRLMPGAIEALGQLKRHGFRLLIISNQSGVGRGKITIDQVHATNAEMLRQLGASHDGTPWFDDILICPHAPEDNCDCRKPKPKLALDAAERFDLDLPASFLVGDKLSDVQCAHNAGMSSIHFTPPDKPSSDTLQRASKEAMYCSDSLLDIAEWISARVTKK